MKKYTRLLAVVLIVIQLFLIISPIQSNALINGLFNLEKTSSVGYTIMSLNYSNPSVKTSFEKLATSALDLKNGRYSYSTAIQVLTETKSVVKKISTSDYKTYQERYLSNSSMNGTMAYQHTYESFIMRNVLYAMFLEKASYTEMLNAMQIIYDTAVIQTQKGAFRSDALRVLVDASALASYITDSKTSDMIYFVSQYASGLSSTYDGSNAIPATNLSTKYQKHIQEEYDKSHGDDNIEHGKDHESEYAPDGYGNQNIDIPSNADGNKPNNDFGAPNRNEDLFMSDSFSSDLSDLYNGTISSKYTLCYTLDKTAENPEYKKTKITTNQCVTYDQIIDALKTVSRNSSLVFVEDSDAVLIVYNGVCSILDKTDMLYTEETIITVFSNLEDFGFALVEEKSNNQQQITT